MTVLHYPGPLPVGALVAHRPVIAPPLWFSAGAEATLTIGPLGGVTGWQAVSGGQATARNVFYNLEGTDRDAAHGALMFQADRHSGLILPAALPARAPFSLALQLSPTAKEPRTLVTLQSAGAEDYLFLKVEAGELRLCTKSGSELAAVADPGGRLLVVLAFSETGSRIALNAGPVTQGRRAAWSGPVNLFLGCRGDARSLRNKLGCFNLYDLWLWPGVDVLDGSATASAALAPALGVWQERQSDAL